MLTTKDIHKLKQIFVTREEFKNSLILFKDEILGEVKAMREELAIVVGYRQHIEDHADKLDEQRQKLMILGQEAQEQLQRTIELSRQSREHEERMLAQEKQTLEHKQMLARQDENITAIRQMFVQIMNRQTQVAT